MIKKLTPVLTATIAFVLGYLWYSKYLFKGLWEKCIGKTMSEEIMIMPMIVGFVFMNIMAFSMHWLIKKAKVPATYQAGLIFGLKIALMFVGASLGIVYVFSGNPQWMIMWAIDAGYQVVFLTIMGTILAVC